VPLQVTRLPWRYVTTGEACDARTLQLRRGDDVSVTGAERLVMSFLSRLVLVTARVRFRIVVTGSLPLTGAVLASYHDSYWDGVVATALSPRIIPITRKRWKAIRVVGWFLESYGVLWTGEDTVERAVVSAGQGGLVWIALFSFVRGGVRERGRQGAANICICSGVPLVPLVFEGVGRESRRRWRRSAVRVAVGTPMYPAADESAIAFTAHIEAVLRPTGS
jgi:1-acyl-sn-glycerol-3-phosphate acyltransferase